MKVTTLELDADDRRLLHKGASRWKTAIQGALNRISGMGYDQAHMQADLDALAGSDAAPELIDRLELQGNLFDPQAEIEEAEEKKLRAEAAMTLEISDRETRVLYFAAKYEAARIDKLRTSLFREGYRAAPAQERDLVRLRGGDDLKGLIPQLDRGWEVDEDQDQLSLDDEG